MTSLIKLTAVAGMTILATAGGALAQGVIPATPQAEAPKESSAAAANPKPTRTVTVGYLGLENDPRYAPEVVYTRIEIAPSGDPVQGAEMGVSDMQMLADAAGFIAKLDEEKAADAPSLIAKVKDMVGKGDRFIVLDLPANLVDQVASATKDLKVTLVNATAPDDYLRNRCYPNLLHTAASDRMLADSLVQLLRTRNWTNVLMLVGTTDRDKEIAASFKASADRLRLNIVDTRTLSLSTDAEHREQNNTQLLTGGVDYDVIYVADTDGEFARYLPYATQLARPVIGATGLTAAEWQWSWDRDGATQVTSRFDKLTNGREMDGHDWSAWIATRAVVTAYGKARSDDPEKVDAFMRGPRFGVDGSKGVQLSFRPWDGQMRMPITMSTFNAVIEVAPMDGFEHEKTTLDTLGTDEPEHVCQ